VIRFWDTSALVKVYSSSEAGHRRAVGLLHTRRPRLAHATSMIVAVELVTALVRRTRDRTLAEAALAQLDGMSQVEFGVEHRDAALRLGLQGLTRGADTAIAAQALVLARAATERIEFVTADAAQARLVEREASARSLDLAVVRLPV
jgi:predicted nucleic acid-binding protein